VTETQEIQPVTVDGLKLVNFRNAESAQYTFGTGLVFITGNNGAGKTSILEAIGLSSFLRSFRFALDREMVRFGSSFYRIETSFSVGNAKHRLSLAFGRNPEDPKAALVKKYMFDGRTNTRAAEIIGRMPAVVLSPDDLGIIAGEHADRRRFLDLLLSMLYPAYFTALQQYQRALKLRSQALKSRPDEGLLAAIDRELAGAGMQILEKRRHFIPEFAAPFKESVSRISAGKDDWQMVYLGETRTVNSVDEYMVMLRDRRANDLRLRQTTTGIHRDRIFFLAARSLHNLQATDDATAKPDIRTVGSQGQKRTAALALKMAQFHYLQAKLMQRPVLLIDDVLNELDLGRRASFVDFLGNVGQVFFTTTDLVGMQDFLKELRQTKPVQNIEL
jgi:DNA replication and repair protein RecF